MSYLHWLIAISLAFVLLERLRPWRKGQPLFRPGFGRDLGFLALNGHVLSLLTAGVNGWLAAEATGLLQRAGLLLPATPIAGWRRTQITFQAPHTTGNTRMGIIGSARSVTYSAPAITRSR